MQLKKPLTLASGSAVRAALLRAAGLSFAVQASGVDEGALKKAHQGDTKKLALALAEAKARAVAVDGLIIGADQLLECDGRLFNKPRNIEEARENLLFLRQKIHFLVGGVVLVENNNVVWHHVGRVTMTVRKFSHAFLETYLAEIDTKTLDSVGGYQLEGLGAHLFERIEGDYFSVLGLPLLPLLQALRTHGGLAE